MRTSLRQLPRETRRALLTRYYGELDDDDAAVRLGIATATVRTRIHRALARLRPRLADVRAWLPPWFARHLTTLGTRAATVGLAPVLVTVLVVARAAPPPPAVGSGGPIANAIVDRSPRRCADDGLVVAPPDSPSPIKPAPPPRAARRAATATPAVAPSPESTRVASLDREAPMREAPMRVEQVLHPEALDVFAEPERAAPRCLVDAPPSFMAQIDKMLDDLL